MTVGAGISASDGGLMVLGKRVLHDLKENIVVTPASGAALINGAFIGVTSDQIGSRRVFPIGKLEYVPLSFLSFSNVWSLYFSSFNCCLVSEKTGREKGKESHM